MTDLVRTETDSMGAIDVPADRYYGAQSARSLHYFNIGTETMPPQMIQAMAIVKKAAALTNHELGILSTEKMELIVKVAEEIIDGKHFDHFPLHIWQTGSGTQSNMNMNEVISNRAIEMVGGVMGSKTPIHPNDHVNLSQSTNDTFPTAMHIATAMLIHNHLMPSIDTLITQLETKQKEFQTIIKIGRTHLQDAVPITLGQVFSGYIAQIHHAKQAICANINQIYRLAIGGTAVGTGLNTHRDYAKIACSHIAKITNLPFTSAENKFAALACHDEMVLISGNLKMLATAANKIANDFRWLGSGPRCGIGELNLPENEPGSSIMPGKVNPTQSESLMMICAQIVGNDAAITMAANASSFEVHVFKPVIIYNLIQSIVLLSDGCQSFAEHCVAGTTANIKKIDAYLHQSLILVTALNPVIGYDKAAQIAKKAHHEGISLKEACLALGYLDEESFDEAIQPEKMLEPTE